jgi:hypothetical protein
MQHRLISAVTALLALAAGSHALAQDAEHALGQHPAVLVQRQQPTINPNTFIVAHPAGLALVATPSPTYAHPAVAVQRMARSNDDAARLAVLIAQPPVATHWLRDATTSVATRGNASGS